MSDFQVVPGSTPGPSPFLSGQLQASGTAPFFGDASVYGGLLHKASDGKGALPGPAAFAAPAGFDGKQLVPQLLVPPGVMAPPPQGAVRLTTAQAAELEMARRRAQKAAEGKRANATAMRRAKRRAGQLATRAEAAVPERPAERAPRDEDEDDQGDGEDDLEAKLANTKDEKEAKRLKRLLRNRVSAQQARERKKSYVSNLENSNKEQAQRIAELEQQVQTLQNDASMLRQILKNIRGAKE